MASRLELHEELCELLGSRNVYYSPPESVKMSYPCIRYSLSGIQQDYANDEHYRDINKYEVIVIDPDPDSSIHLWTAHHFAMCSFDRAYVADNLNHFVLTLYY